MTVGRIEKVAALLGWSSGQLVELVGVLVDDAEPLPELLAELLIGTHDRLLDAATGRRVGHPDLGERAARLMRDFAPHGEVESCEATS